MKRRRDAGGPALPDEWIERLALGVRAQVLDDARRIALRERVMAAARTATPEGTRTLRAGTATWEDFGALAKVRWLQRDGANGVRLAVWRLAPGGVVPAAQGACREEVLVLEGSCHLGELVLAAGGHAVRTEEGAELRSAGVSAVELLVRTCPRAALSPGEPPSVGGRVAAGDAGLAWLDQAMAQDVAPAMLPAATRSRLKARVLAQARASHADAGGWESLAEGVSHRVLHIERGAGEHSVLYRLQPGARIEPHGHEVPEECYVVSGRISIGNLKLAPGDFHWAQRDTLHAPLLASGPALLWVHGATTVSPPPARA